MGNWTSYARQREATLLLREAGHLNLKGMLPDYMKLSIGSHDTGCQPRITLSYQDLPAITAWEGSVWYASHYEFNDRDKVLGLNPECVFVRDTLEAFFEAVNQKLIDAKANQVANAEARKMDAASKHAAALDVYRRLAN